MNLYCIYIIICMPLLITILYSQCKIVSEFVLVFTPSATLVYRVRVTFFARIVFVSFSGRVPLFSCASRRPHRGTHASFVFVYILHNTLVEISRLFEVVFLTISRVCVGR